MRNAIYGGTFQKHLVELNENIQWRAIFGNKHKRGKDIELILRFLALYNWETDYKESMKIFLNRFMKQYKNADSDQLNQFKDQFSITLDRIYQALGDEAFRLGHYNGFNAPFFDSFMVAVASDDSISKTMIANAHDVLKKDNQFLELTRSATTNSTTIKKRISSVRETLNASA